MNAFTEDLWTIIIVRLPLKNITTSKLVCKQWKSIAESPYFRDMFLSLHQNSHSSWSLMTWDYTAEVLAHYGCDTWGLERSLGSYMSSFLTDKFKTKRDKYRVWAYTDVGLILISEDSFYVQKRSLYVTNPVSQECVKLPSHTNKYSLPLGIATRTENGVLLDYKVVLVDYDEYSKNHSSLLIYSSETGLWSLSTVHLPFPFSYQDFQYVICLKEKIHWFARKSVTTEEIVSINVYATGMGSDQCRITPFPDLGKHPRFERTCTTCQGFLMYMNIVSSPKVDGSLEDKLCVWRLNSGEWQLVSEITPSFIDSGFEYFLLGINPFDAKTVYFWSKKHQSLLSINLGNGNFVLHSELEHSSNDHTLISVEDYKDMNYINGSHFRSCVLPQWLHRIPVRRVS